TPPCPTSWAAWPPRRWSCGETTIGWCRSSAASATPRRCPTRACRSSSAPGTSSKWNGRTSCRGSSPTSSRVREIPMHLMHFPEQPMSAYDAQAGRDFGATALMFSNKHYDPVAGSRLYNEYLEHYRLVEEVGFDGIMLNEHHNAPFCMQAKCNVF